MNKVTGKVIDIQTQSGDNKNGGWTRTTVVVETESKFNNTVPVSFFNDTPQCSVGDNVEVEFYVGGREYQGKYYAQIDGKSVSVTSSGGNATPPVAQPKGVADDIEAQDSSVQLPF